MKEYVASRKLSKKLYFFVSGETGLSAGRKILIFAGNV